MCVLWSAPVSVFVTESLSFTLSPFPSVNGWYPGPCARSFICARGALSMWYVVVFCLCDPRKCGWVMPQFDGAKSLYCRFEFVHGGNWETERGDGEVPIFLMCGLGVAFLDLWSWNLLSLHLKGGVDFLLPPLERMSSRSAGPASSVFLFPLIFEHPTSWVGEEAQEFPKCLFFSAH